MYRDSLLSRPSIDHHRRSAHLRPATVGESLGEETVERREGAVLLELVLHTARTHRKLTNTQKGKKTQTPSLNKLFPPIYLLMIYSGRDMP